MRPDGPLWRCLYHFPEITDGVIVANQHLEGSVAASLGHVFSDRVDVGSGLWHRVNYLYAIGKNDPPTRHLPYASSDWITRSADRGVMFADALLARRYFGSC